MSVNCPTQNSAFISHSNEDKEFVRRLASDLESRGIKTWVDEARIQPGDNFSTKIENGLTKATHILIVLSPHSVRSKWVLKEIEAAQIRSVDDQVKLIPVLVGDFDVSAIPLLLRSRLYIDFRNPDSYEQQISELITALDEGGTLSVLTIEGVGPAKKLHLELAERVNLFTGDNGLGKSFILECAWWALSGNWTSFPAHPREDANRNEPKIYFQIEGATEKANKGGSSYDWEKQEWSSLEERPAIPGLLIYARIDGAFAVWDPARDYWAESVKTKISKPLIFTRDEIWNGLQDNVGGNVTFLSNGLISDWILWQNSPEKEPFNTFKRVLKRLSPPGLEKGDLGILEPGKPTRISGDSRWMPTIKHSYGEIPLVYASAGVRRILALAYLIVWAWEEHKSQSKLIRKPPQQKMVILVDEIEAHLHPQWQRKILAALLEVQQDLAPELRMQLLIATHSPLLMSSVEPIFDGRKDKIFHLNLIKHELSGAEVTLQEPEFVKYGTVDSWLRSEIFELPQPRSLEAEKAIEDAKKLQLKEVVERSEVIEVSDRLMKYLSPHDGFWPRWTFFAEEHGVEL